MTLGVKNVPQERLQIGLGVKNEEIQARRRAAAADYNES